MRKLAVFPNDLQRLYRVEKAKYHHSCQALMATKSISEKQRVVASLRRQMM